MFILLSGVRRYLKLALLSLIVCAPAIGAEGDDDFLRARQAHAAGNSAMFEKSAVLLPATHPLTQYIAYWRLYTGANIANDNLVTNFLSAYPDTLLAERVRGEWLKQLGQRAMWPAYLAEFPRLGRPDPAHQC